MREVPNHNDRQVDPFTWLRYPANSAIWLVPDVPRNLSMQFPIVNQPVPRGAEATSSSQHDQYDSCPCTGKMK
jgi:hypothetical protein